MYLVGLLRRLDGRQHFALRRLWHARHDLIGGRVVQIDPFGRLGFDHFAIDKQLGGGRRFAGVHSLGAHAQLYVTGLESESALISDMASWCLHSVVDDVVVNL